MENEIKKAVEILKRGGIIIFPTDTAYGIGCRIDNEKSIKRLFDIRKRPVKQATPVLVDSIKMAQRYLQPIPIGVKEELMNKYWPGALTIILRCLRTKVPSLVRGGRGTLGVRMPNHEIIRTVIGRLGVPVLAPSANFHGNKTPFRFKDLNPKLVSKVDYALQHDSSLGKTVSTVIDCSRKPWKVIRQGAIKISKF
ncbi:MAG: threonylcarbamoyl-AMP synthase [Candidatus Levybacteria bacterium]|nr:threonylcarbamoyl-AMP synthase [Candidatus Levybacteria bacterium]